MRSKNLKLGLDIHKLTKSEADSQIKKLLSAKPNSNDLNRSNKKKIKKINNKKFINDCFLESEM